MIHASPNKTYSVINSPQVRVATIDGELAETIAQTDFPKAQRVGQPQMAEITTMLLNVKENKADVAFVESVFRISVSSEESWIREEHGAGSADPGISEYDHLAPGTIGA